MYYGENKVSSHLSNKKKKGSPMDKLWVELVLLIHKLSRSSGRSILSPRRRSLTQNCKKQVDEAHRYTNYNAEKEPIKVIYTSSVVHVHFYIPHENLSPHIKKAYLRLRPTFNEQEAEPYIQITNDVEITMTPPIVNFS